MASKVVVDLAGKLIIVNAGVTALDVEPDLYSALKQDWIGSTNGETKMEFPFDTAGGDPIGAGLTVGAYFFLRNDLGWRIRPHEANHELKISGNLYPKDANYPIIVPTLGGFTVLPMIERSSLTQGVKPPPGLRRATPVAIFPVVMRSSVSHQPQTGLRVTGQVSIDGSPFSALAHSVVENGNGLYDATLDGPEMDGEMVTLRFVASGADPSLVTIKTSPA